MPDLDSCIPLPLDEKTLAEVVDKSKDWAIMHGAAMRSKADFNPDALQVSRMNLHFSHNCEHIPCSSVIVHLTFDHVYNIT